MSSVLYTSHVHTPALFSTDPSSSPWDVVGWTFKDSLTAVTPCRFAERNELARKFCDEQPGTDWHFDFRFCDRSLRVGLYRPGSEEFRSLARHDDVLSGRLARADKVIKVGVRSVVSISAAGHVL